MEKLGGAIVKIKYVSLAVFLLLAIAGGYFMGQVKQNYDLSGYLDENTDTKQALNIMEDEFGLNSIIEVMVETEQKNIPSIKKKLSAVDGVALVSFDGYKDGQALFLINADGDDYSENATAAIKGIKEALDGSTYIVSGAAASSAGLRDALQTEIPIILGIAIFVILIILLIGSHSWLEPIIFIIVVGMSVLINMGSNIILGSISYITFSVAAILQLALSMDYSIILLHSYTSMRDEGFEPSESMKKAVASSIKPIFSSGLTTVAGLIALVFMSFRIGLDLGIVLAKGIIISVLTVILVMPALILLFRKALEKTSHKPVKFRGKAAKISLKWRSVITTVMAVVIAAGCFLQAGNTYSFSGWETDNSGKKITEIFGNNNQTVLIIDDEFAFDEEAEQSFLAETFALKNENGTPALKAVSSWNSLNLESQSINEVLNEVLSTMSLAIFGSPGIDVSALSKAWEDAQGDIYQIKISKAVVASLVGDLAANLLVKDESIEFFALLEKISLLGNNPIAAESMPKGLLDIVNVLIAQKENVSQSLNSLLDEFIGNLEIIYAGEIVTIDDLSLDYSEIFSALFGSEFFDVSAFDELLRAAENDLLRIAVTPSQAIALVGIENNTENQAIVLKMFGEIGGEDSIQVGELIEYVYQNKENRTVVNLLGERKIQIIETAYFLAPGAIGLITPVLEQTLSTLRQTFVGSEHGRLILNFDIVTDTRNSFEVLEAVKQSANKYYGEDNYLGGNSMVVYDISNVFASDVNKINFITVFAIFLIIGLAFRSIGFPLLLVFVIQGAIWITMGICAIIGQPIFFMSYIICTCILMGATIDYGILICNNYRRNRAIMPAREAISEAVRLAMPTIFSSGSVLVFASGIIGIISTVMPIYSIGRLLCMGTIISVILVLFLLPALLNIFDKAISLTTFDGIKPYNGER